MKSSKVVFLLYKKNLKLRGTVAIIITISKTLYIHYYIQEVLKLDYVYWKKVNLYELWLTDLSNIHGVSSRMLDFLY